MSDEYFMIIIVPALFIVAIIMAIIVWGIYFFSVKKDDNKELEVRTAKILEKIVQQGNIEWYFVEYDSGERVKLRNLKAYTLIITTGDIGRIYIKGNTIQEFQRF